jgi:hypothetical protein
VGQILRPRAQQLLLSQFALGHLAARSVTSLVHLNGVYSQGKAANDNRSGNLHQAALWTFTRRISSDAPKMPGKKGFTYYYSSNRALRRDYGQLYPMVYWATYIATFSSSFAFFSFDPLNLTSAGFTPDIPFRWVFSCSTHEIRINLNL